MNLEGTLEGKYCVIERISLKIAYPDGKEKKRFSKVVERKSRAQSLEIFPIKVALRLKVCQLISVIAKNTSMITGATILIG